MLTSLSGIDDPGRLADTIAAHMGVDLEKNSEFWKSPTSSSVWST